VSNLQSNISKLTPLFDFLKKQREIEKNRKIFELSITFAIISIFLFFAIRPTFLTISTLLGDIKSKELLTVKMRTKIDQIITAQDNFSQVQEKYYLVQEALPETQNFVSAFNQIDSNSVKSDINFDKLTFSQSEKDYFSTKISTRASYSSSIALLTSLFNIRRIINIPQVVFSKDKDSQLQNQINFSIPIDIFYWKK
jgi:hypothetical protein